jgi:hypothetical protein
MGRQSTWICNMPVGTKFLTMHEDYICPSRELVVANYVPCRSTAVVINCMAWALLPVRVGEGKGVCDREGGIQR